MEEVGPDGASAIHHAAWHGRLDVVTWLLVKRPNLVQATTAAGQTPRDLAAAAGHEAVVRHLERFEAVREGPFGFVNIGMFARLADGRGLRGGPHGREHGKEGGKGLGVRPGEVFACIRGHSVAQRGLGGRLVVVDAHEMDTASSISPLDAGLPLVELLGISDEMPFVTPDAYERDSLMALFPKQIEARQKEAATAEATAREVAAEAERVARLEAKALEESEARQSQEEEAAESRRSDSTTRS